MSVQDFLKGLRRAMKSKESKVELSSGTYWATTAEKLDEAAHASGVLVELLGLEYDENDRMYLTFLASAEGSGDQKRLAYQIPSAAAE